MACSSMIDFHFVDPRLGKKDFAGQPFISAQHGLQSPVDGTFDGAGLRNQIVH